MDEHKEYYAKSHSKNGPVTNRSHLARVADLASRFGCEIGRESEARCAGLFHDFGKYSPLFADVLAGKAQGVDHALPGATFLYALLKLTPQKPKPFLRHSPLLESIQAHHDGLVSLRELIPVFCEVWKDPQADCCPSGKISSLRGAEEFQKAGEAFRHDFPDYKLPSFSFRVPQNIIEAMLDTRMLFSCLVDADYSTSAMDDDPDHLQKSSGPQLDIENSLQRLYKRRAYLQAEADLQEKSESAAKLNQIRSEVFDLCGDAGERYPCGIFTLTAPTGVGKTLAMMHFALRHCRHERLRRIIIVLPYLTLSNQSEKEYRNIFSGSEFLVDHSQRDLPESQREFAARWDCPVILTTSVHFFESLFSDQSGSCRRLHSIANSVVLFDESQSLPSDLAAATVQAVQSLCSTYHCSMLFSTATQPDFGSLPDVSWAPCEILPNHADYYARLQRVHAEWRLYTDQTRQNAPTLADIAQEMQQYSSVCAIVNLRRHARELFNALRNHCKDDGVFLISSDLCPAHRDAIVERIKQRLHDELPCRVVATQCIEAGVSLDFAVMYRALAPLESIIQAAGRCNRNGRLGKNGRLIVFEPKESGRLYPGDFYEQAANIVKMLWAKDPALDLSDLSLIHEYYQRLLSGHSMRPALKKALELKNYRDVAREYRLIKQTGVQVIVPWKVVINGDRDLYAEVSKEYAKNGLTASLQRKAAPITVSCLDREWVELHAEPLLYPAQHGCVTQKSSTYILNAGQEKAYNDLTGLTTGRTVPEDFMV